MEVRDKNIGDSKFRLPRFSSVEAASIMETEYEGSTVKCAAKLHSPDEDRKLAFAAKKYDHFEFIWMKMLKKDCF